MAKDTRDTMLRAAGWTPTADVQEGLFGDAAWWLTGGATLLIWTAIALVLTST